MIDLRPRLRDPAVRSLLALALGSGPDQLERACQNDIEEPRWILLGLEARGALVGCIGVEPRGSRHAVIRHIAVLPAHQRHGVGRAMIAFVQRQYAFMSLEAETDADAVSFYERCGFAITSLGERFPGIERFRCIWARPTNQEMAG
ncbi:MAG TPA: GNAT family N-acetyltransferase [Dehalococcoidia bacterium]|nr:GNAT family N-acetyltransferase [Dehalococcoidia bacterium]